MELFTYLDEERFSFRFDATQEICTFIISHAITIQLSKSDMEYLISSKSMYRKIIKGKTNPNSQDLHATLLVF